MLGSGLGSDESGDFGRYGEITDPRRRSAAYDEALDLMADIWTGRPGRREGRTYAVDLPAGVPPTHRIPIWIANSRDSAAVIARAVRHDGIFPHRGRDPLTPHDVRRLVERLREAGLPPERPFGSAVSGNASQPGAIPSRSTSPPSPRRGQRGGWSR